MKLFKQFGVALAIAALGFILAFEMAVPLHTPW
jgi:hypothetical protein